jgi:hypothetical protein
VPIAIRSLSLPPAGLTRLDDDAFAPLGSGSQKSRKIVNSKIATSGSGPLGGPVTWANMSPKLEAGPTLCPSRNGGCGLEPPRSPSRNAYWTSRHTRSQAHRMYFRARRVACPIAGQPRTAARLAPRRRTEPSLSLRIGECLEEVSSDGMHGPSGLDRVRGGGRRCAGSRYSLSPSLSWSSSS